jgi:GTP-binding protein
MSSRLTPRSKKHTHASAKVGGSARAASPSDRLERIPEFASASFVKSVVDEVGMPEETGAEIAFVGRSNAGKSSSINKLVGQTKLAFASKLPGRTRELNFFALRGGGYIVDLPGYGFAKTPRDKQRVWSGLIEAYLRKRHALAGIVLVTDIRRAPDELDLEFLEWLDEPELPRPPLLWLLNKADKLTQSERMKREHEAKVTLEPYLAENDAVVLFSAQSGLGMKHCATTFSRWLNKPSASG